MGPWPHSGLKAALSACDNANGPPGSDERLASVVSFRLRDTSGRRHRAVVDGRRGVEPFAERVRLMTLTISLIIVVTLALAVVELWAFWMLGERKPAGRARSSRAPSSPSRHRAFGGRAPRRKSARPH